MAGGFPVIERNPIPWINNWLNTKNQQVAPQETQLTNYRVGATTQTSEEELGKLGDDFAEFL